MELTLGYEKVKDIILLALKEDIGEGDITSNAIFTGGEQSEAYIVAKQDGVFCGGILIAYVYRALDPSVTVTPVAGEGSHVRRGDTTTLIKGPTRSLLTGERTALNFAQRTSGIATKTAAIAELLEGSGISLLDTRKTAPGLRLIDKYAVKAGGGTNHRIGLFDMVMIKDNHIRAAGGISRAVEMARTAYGSRYPIEVETTSLAEVREAAASGIEVIMLDNMDTQAMKEAVAIIGGRAKVEISGNVDEERIKEIKGLGVDYISMGALTHSVSAFDLSMKFR